MPCRDVERERERGGTGDVEEAEEKEKGKQQQGAHIKASHGVPKNGQGIR